jgi:hypothetical protein
MTGFSGYGSRMLLKALENIRIKLQAAQNKENAKEKNIWIL